MEIEFSYPGRSHRPSKPIPLCFVAPEPYRGRFLLRCLDHFGDRCETEVPRHSDYGPDDCGVTHLPVRTP